MFIMLFFVKQKTAYELRISDWSSDVCSSDLKEYPRRAQLRRHSGVAHLRFTIDGEGHVLTFRVERSSGHESRDDAVERMIRKAEPLPPITAALGQQRLALGVTVQRPVERRGGYDRVKASRLRE